MTIGTASLLFIILHTGTVSAEEITVFDKEQISEVNIEIDEEDFEDMLENPLEEEYKEATITYNGKEIPYTGVRVKGNSSLSSVANSDSDRYSFKLKFNEYIEQDLEGYTKISLNNNFADPSYMREYLTYEMMESMGIPTPEYSYVRVSVNGELYGFYLSVENIEEPYLEKSFGSAAGNLFKGETGASLTWEDGMSIEETNLTQKVGLETNTGLLDFMEALSKEENVEDYLDVDSYLRYLAVSTVLANMDSYQGNFSHNYYLYEQDGVFHFLPWDHNMSFGGMGNGGDQISMLIDEPTIGAVSEHPLTEFVLSNEDYKETYHTYIQQTIKELDTFEERVDQLQELISDDVKKDPTAFYTYDEFVANSGTGAVDGYPGITSFIEQRLANVQQQLSGQIPSYDNGEGLSGQGAPGNSREEGERQNGEPPEGMNQEQNQDEQIPAVNEGEPPVGMENMPRGMPGMEGNTAAAPIQKKNMIIIAVLTAVLLAANIFIHLFRRYRK